MDWVAFFKDYSTLITATVGVILAIASYFFGKWNAERSRKWELEDREYKRRVEIHDKKIQEARDYIDTMHETFHTTGKLITLLQSNNSLSFDKKADIDELVKQLVDLTDKGGKQSLSIYAFYDSELESLHDDTTTMTLSEIDYITGVARLILNGGRARVDNKRLNMVSDSYSAAEARILLMKQRIDALAQKVPEK